MLKTEKAMIKRAGNRFVFGAVLPGVIVLLFNVLLVSPLCAAELLSLEDAIAEALVRNQDIQVAKGEEKISSNNVNIGNAGLLPKVDLVGSVNYQDNEEPSVSGLTEFTSTGATLQANYTLFDGFGNIYTFRKLKSAGRLGRYQARNDIEQVILQVSEAYYRLADATEQVAVAKEALAISGERLKRARLRSEYGQANTLEVLSASVDANADSVAWKDALLGMENANRTLNLLLNRPIDASYRVKKEYKAFVKQKHDKRANSQEREALLFCISCRS